MKKLDNSISVVLHSPNPLVPSYTGHWGILEQTTSNRRKYISKWRRRFRATDSLLLSEKISRLGNGMTETYENNGEIVNRVKVSKKLFCHKLCLHMNFSFSDEALGTCCTCAVMSIYRLVKLSWFHIHSAFVYQLLVQCSLEY